MSAAGLFSRLRLSRLWRDRRAVTAIWLSVAAPALMAASSLGIEASRWSLARVELQRAADMAAIAGAMSYALTYNAQSSALRAASVAEINGASGGATRAWNATTQSMSDGNITVTVGPGVTSSSKISVKVVVTRSLSPTFSVSIGQVAAKKITATSIAETWSISLNPTPCIVGLDPENAGVNTQVDITLSGTTSVTLTNCSMRSNANISIGGNATVTSSGIFAAGTISTFGSSSVTGSLVPNAGTITDPYASNARMQAALSQLATASKSNFADANNKSTTALSPGVWASWNIKGSVTLAPGLYVVTGAITINAQASVSGTGVTIVHGGTMSMNGGATLNLTAPGATPTGNAVSGVIYANNTSQSFTFGGNSSSNLSGVIYSPTANITFHGTNSSGSNGCLEVIAGTVTLTGNSTMASNCSGLGAASMRSIVPSVALVQ
jgi:Flp pilus assembly protein TadG